MSGRVNTAAVEAAALRHMRAAAAGRTYEEQLKVEGGGGRFGGTNRSQLQAGQPDQGQRGQEQRAGGRAGQRAAVQPAAPAAEDDDQDALSRASSALGAAV
jgi:hypothetical protein